jgi:hypothetical protein
MKCKTNIITKKKKLENRKCLLALFNDKYWIEYSKTNLSKNRNKYTIGFLDKDLNIEYISISRFSYIKD